MKRSFKIISHPHAAGGVNPASPAAPPDWGVLKRMEAMLVEALEELKAQRRLTDRVVEAVFGPEAIAPREADGSAVKPFYDEVKYNRAIDAFRFRNKKPLSDYFGSGGVTTERAKEMGLIQ